MVAPLPHPIPLPSSPPIHTPSHSLARPVWSDYCSRRMRTGISVFLLWPTFENITDSIFNYLWRLAAVVGEERQPGVATCDFFVGVALIWPPHIHLCAALPCVHFKLPDVLWNLSIQSLIYAQECLDVNHQVQGSKNPPQVTYLCAMKITDTFLWTPSNNHNMKSNR